MAFWDNYNVVNNTTNPKTDNGNVYNYEVTDKSTGTTEYLTQKGMDAVNNQTKNK